MSFVFFAALLLLLCAFTWSLVLWRRLRDARIAFLSALTALMATSLVVTLIEGPVAEFVLVGGRFAALTAVGVGALVLVTIVAVGRMLMQMRLTTEAVEDREARLMAILNTTVDAIVTIDGAGVVETFNPAAEAMFGYAAAEVVGGNVSMLMPAPESGRHDEYIARYLRTGQKKIIGIGREAVGLRKGGTTFPLYLGVGERGDGIGFTGILRDITEQRRGEAALESSRRTLATLMSNLPGMAYRCRNDRHREVQFASGGSVQLLGYTPDELIDGAHVSFAALIHPEDRERVRDEVRVALAEQRAFHLTYRVTTAEGDERWVSEHGCGIRAADGGVEALEGFITDISERKRLEEEILQSQKMEAVGRLAGGIAHDFNNLLTGIIGCARIAAKGLEPGSDAEQQIKEVRAAAERGAGLTRQLLSFSRRKTTEPEPILLDRVVESVETLIRRLLGEDVRLSLELRAGGGPIVADAGQIEQVLLNLAVNARDAMPGGGVLRISTSVVDADGDGGGPRIVLEVADSGCGMDAETRARAFEPFFTTKADAEGTGLGLSTVYGIVTQLGGTVQLDSKVGRGTCFRMKLPRSESLPADEQRTPAPAITEGRETVLVVEDDRLVRAGVRHVLEEQGYHVLLASNGQEALRLCDEYDGGIDLLLTDMIMPGMGGAQLADAIRAKRPGVKVLFMSALPLDVLVEQGRLDPDRPSVQKPFEDAELAEKIRELLDP